MEPDPIVRRIMNDFAVRTRLLAGERVGTRYLWTDAFAVCNLLGLFVREHEDEMRRRALHLVDQVHYTLGRHHPDDPRDGWISGLDDAEAEEHPTIGGLRIGKPLPERGPGQPYEDTLEWERDGQYFHYLTKWMHALDRASRLARDPRYHRWAVELAKTAHERFTCWDRTSGRMRMHWKMSTDLGRTLVPTMGQHDPLDGLVTFIQLDVACSGVPELTLSTEIDDMARLCAGQSWVTADPLGIGELLAAAYKLAQLGAGTAIADSGLLEEILWSSARGLESLARQRPFEQSAEHRLAFRELGLSIGLAAVSEIQLLSELHPHAGGDGVRMGAALEILHRHECLRDQIIAFWLEPTHQENPGWSGHRDINEVHASDQPRTRGLPEPGRTDRNECGASSPILEEVRLRWPHSENAENRWSRARSLRAVCGTRRCSLPCAPFHARRSCPTRCGSSSTTTRHCRSRKGRRSHNPSSWL